MHSSSGSKKKVGILIRYKETEWMSCIHINRDLLHAYSEAAESVEHYRLYGQNSRKVSEEIIQSNAQVLVFLDHQIRPLEILRQSKLIDHIKSRNLKVIFHIYGCYPDRLLEFEEILSILGGVDVHFVASSPAQTRLMEETLISPEGSVHCVPFPTHVPQQILNDNRQLRARLGLPSEGTIFLYTGRISTLKNVELSMKLLSEIRKKIKDVIFVYIGPFDNFEPILANDRLSNPSVINAKLLHEIDPEGTWCFYRPRTSWEDLQEYYLCSDAFISLSVSGGEDFGRSVLEASSYGLPCFLTRWGGYGGFSHLPETHYAPVELETKDIRIDLNTIVTALNNFRPLSYERKLKKIEAVRSTFGVEASASTLHGILGSKSSHPGGIKKQYKVQALVSRKTSAWEKFRNFRNLYEKYVN